jgi:hypothetical protein
MTRQELVEKMVSMLMEYDIETHHEIINQLSQDADEAWLSMCDEAWTDYACRI